MGDRPRAMRLAVLASVVIVVAGFGYLISLLLNIPSGFPMPPTTATRVIASLSVLGSAPGLVAFAYAMSVLCRTRATNIAFVTSVTLAPLSLSPTDSYNWRIAALSADAAGDEQEIGYIGLMSWK